MLIHQVIPLMRLRHCGGDKLDTIVEMIHIHPALNEIVRNAALFAVEALVEAGDDTVPARLIVKSF